jgi:hypothetical protein
MKYSELSNFIELYTQNTPYYSPFLTGFLFFILIIIFSVKQQLAQNIIMANEAAEKADAMASGSPKGVYTTLALLQSAYPTGATVAYLVTDDGNWYYWNGTTWTPGGVYQTIQWLHTATTQNAT